jgi:hypothetical protein
MSMTTILPVEQRTVDFNGTALVALRDNHGTIWVPLRRLCEAIGVAFTNQIKKIQSDPVMSEHIVTLPIVLSDGRTFEMECLALKYVRAWLFGINANRVKVEIRDRLLAYQREVIEVIDRAFTPASAESGLDDTMIRAMRDNALQQAQLWEMVLGERQRLRRAEQALDEIDEQMGTFGQLLYRHDDTLRHVLNDLNRLRAEQSAITARFTDITRLLPAPNDFITPEEKAALKALVDDVVAAAHHKGVRLGQGRNDYPAVWDAFKRRFDLAKYDELPRTQYADAIEWLKAWLDRIQ